MVCCTLFSNPQRLQESLVLPRIQGKHEKATNWLAILCMLWDEMANTGHNLNNNINKGYFYEKICNVEIRVHI